MKLRFTQMAALFAVIVAVSSVNGPVNANDGSSSTARAAASTAARSILPRADTRADGLLAAVQSRLAGGTSPRIATQVVPSTTPVFTAPTQGSVVNGTAAAAVTSTATEVRFAFGDWSAQVAVVDGVAQATVPAWGYAGSLGITAQDCSVDGCGTSVTRVISVANTPPVFTVPTAGQQVGTSFVAAVNNGGGTVRFLLDGAGAAGPVEPPYQVTISTNGLANGAHTVTAVQCSAAGNCGGPSVNVGVQVTNRLAPELSAISPNPFSPNKDGIKDTAVVEYSLDRTQDVDLSVFRLDGTRVRGPISLGSRTAGSHGWTFNGKANNGDALPSGSYVVRMRTSATIGGTHVTGQAERGVRIDVTRPTASSGAAATVFPVRDGYKDTTMLRAYLPETAGTAVQVLDASGRRIRQLSGGVRGPGWVAIAWDGRAQSGALAPAGRLSFKFVMRDVAGNQGASRAWPVQVSHKKLVRKTGTQTLVPKKSIIGTLIGPCSEVVYPARSGWAGSLAYLSNYNLCFDPSVSDDIAVTRHSATMPAAVKYGPIRVSTYGARDVPGFADLGVVLYETRSGDISDYGAVLRPGLQWHQGDSVDADAFVTSGRKFRWWGGTVGGNFYDILEYKVSYTYFVLS